MSECVVRMEMPKGCGYCPIANFGYCSINHKQVGDPLMGYPENRPANCPIICSLPEGHGRLIDADALNLDHKVEMAVEMAVDWKTAHMISNVVKYAPTIVPAEAERSET